MNFLYKEIAKIINMDYTFIIIGTACLILGAVIHFLAKSRASFVLAWLLIALFPVFLLFSFSSENLVEGEILNFKFGGAAAAFAFIWYFGTTLTMKGANTDKLEATNTQLNDELVNTKEKLAAVQSGDGALLRRAKPLQTTEKYQYKIKGQNTQIGLITGDIRNIRGVDIWVNSENTNMEMARFYENSISGIIRYMGARKDGVGNVKEDIIPTMLRREVGNNMYVQPATVLATGAGELEKTNQVKKILHVAAVHGEVGIGYHPVRNIQNCVKNALTKADTLNNVTSILFPIFATGLANGDTESISEKLINEAVTYLKSNSNTKLKDVYFLAYTDKELEDCLKVMNKHASLG